jgi:trk system potassium uptake protein TrkH
VLVLLVSTWGLLHGKRDTVLFDRRIASETVDKAYNVFTVCLLWMLGAYFLLLICDGGLHRADYVLFEVVSAFATVGLGVGITPDWNDWGKLILVLTMYAGRIGVLTFVLSFLHSKDDKIRYPSENIMIG